MPCSFDARSPFVADLATVALIVILFRDGLEVEGEMLQSHWHLPLRKLVLAMPLTAVIVALGTKLLTDLSWTEAFLLGALLSPTDPVLSSSVVTNPRVPRLIRHSLNLESGLNDGLALPAVLALAAALTISGQHFVWWRFVFEDVTIGLATGPGGGVRRRLADAARARVSSRGIPPHQKSLYALGTAFAAYGIAVLPPRGNGLIAVFVAAITLGIRRADIRSYFERQAEDLVEIVKLGIFVVFGSLLTLHGLFGDGWAAVGIVAVTLLVARPVAVFTALAGTPTERGDPGVHVVVRAQGRGDDDVLAARPERPHHRRARRIFNIAALVVFCSIIAHGATDTPGAEWIARRRTERRAGAAASAPVGAAARGIHDPAEEDRRRSTKAMNPPISGQNMAGETYQARRAARASTRAARPARWPTETPMRPAAGAPGGTRTAAGWAVAVRRDGPGRNVAQGPVSETAQRRFW